MPRRATHLPAQLADVLSMGIEFSETTCNHLEAVHQLWEACGGTQPSDRPVLTLSAHDGDQLVGAVMCRGNDANGYVGAVVVEKSHQDGELGRHLVESVVEKLKSLGIHRCRMDLSMLHKSDNGAEREKDADSPDEDERFWGAAEWSNWPDFDDARHVVRVTGRY